MSEALARLTAALSRSYRIERELGTGGMATVYLAHDVKHDRQVALKVLKPELGAVLGAERFLAEIKVTANLHHPNLLPLFDSGAADGMLYYVMPYIEGETLRARLDRERQLPVDETIRLVTLMAGALDYAHARGVIHRDLKPENILLQAGQPVIADFGIALAVAHAGGTRITETGLSLGTPHYMSPEQATGDRIIDARADQYSLAAVAYEMLTGEPPHTGATAQAIIARLLTETPRSVRATRPTVSAALNAAIHRALAKSPADRFASCGDFARALGAAPTPGGAGGSVLRRRALGAVVAGLVIVAATVLLLINKRSAGSVAGADTRSIAVLPLTNLSGDKSDDYFGIGLAEEMTRALAKAGARVIGRVSAGALLAKGLDEREIAKELGVGSLLTGSVQREGGQVRISVTLSAANGVVRWTQAYDRPITNVFAVQDEIAREVARELLGSLGVKPAGTLVRNETEDPEAHAQLLQGIVLWNRRTAPAIRQAISLFEQAVVRDPRYARAQAWLAMANVTLAFYVDDNTDSLLTRAQAAADRAIAIDSTISEAFTASGNVQTLRWHGRQADERFRQALARDSTLATTWFWSGLLALRAGNFAEARRRILRARELEPASLVVRAGEVQIFLGERRSGAADSASNQIIALDSSFALGWYERANALLAMNRDDEAIAILQRRVVGAPGVRPSEQQGILAWALATAGRSVEARTVIEGMRAANGGSLPPVGVLAAALERLGDRAAAISVLGEAIARHDPWMLQHNRGVRYDRLRKDPQAAALLATYETP